MLSYFHSIFEDKKKRKISEVTAIFLKKTIRIVKSTLKLMQT